MYSKRFLRCYFLETPCTCTLCPKKVVHQTHSDNFLNSQRIFKSLSLLEREVNFQQNPYNTFHHTFSMLAHYLAKVRSSSFGISGRKRKRTCDMHWFLNTHPILIHFAYLLTGCFNLFQFQVPVKYSLLIALCFLPVCLCIHTKLPSVHTNV